MAARSRPSYPIRGRLAERPKLQLLILLFAAAWTTAAISPANRQVWMLENIWVVIGIFGMSLAFRRFPFSDTGYLLISIYILLHVIASHYTYEGVPAGFWVEQKLGLSRNDYDRYVHFAFGLLLTYPTRELFLYVRPGMPNWLTHYLSVNSTMALSAVHEIMEAFVGAAADPRAQAGYLSLQGDPLDSQHDMACALAGSLLSMTAVIVYEFVRNRRSSSREEPNPHARPEAGGRQES
jgi:putative membrane protein